MLNYVRHEVHVVNIEGRGSTEERAQGITIGTEHYYVNITSPNP